MGKVKKINSPLMDKISSHMSDDFRNPKRNKKAIKVHISKCKVVNDDEPIEKLDDMSKTIEPTKKVRRTNPWVEHCKKVKAENPGIGYKNVLVLAKSTYVKK